MFSKPEGNLGEVENSGAPTAACRDEATEDTPPPYSVQAPTNHVFSSSQPGLSSTSQASSSTRGLSTSQNDSTNKAIINPTHACQINDFLAFAKRQGDKELGLMKCELMTMQLRLAQRTRDLRRRDESAKKMADDLIGGGGRTWEQILDEVSNEFFAQRVNAEDTKKF